MPEVSIVVPTVGRSGSLSETIAGLDRRRGGPRDIEVLVVIDAEGTTPTALAKPRLTQSCPIDVLHASRAGASAARNAGWRRAKAPVILFLDDDIVPCGRLVAEHLAWHRRWPRAEVAVLGRVRWSPHVKITPFMRWLEMGIMFDYRSIGSTDVGWGQFYSCNASVKRQLLERVGGFDEQRFPFGYEDTELARRMSEVGLRLLYNKRAVGEHLKTETLDSWRRKLERIAVAERRFTRLYPTEQPYFYECFRAAASAPLARGRPARLARWVRPSVPLLGPIVWRSFDRVCSQRLAPEFLAAWDDSESEVAQPGSDDAGRSHLETDSGARSARSRG